MKKLVYGHVVDIEIYKDLLSKSGIEFLEKNEFEEASRAGFGSGLPGNIDLYVDESNYARAVEIVRAFKETNA